MSNRKGFAKSKRARIVLALVAVAAVFALGSRPTQTPASTHVVATTTIVQDLVKQVAGERMRVTSLLAPGMDPHTYQPTPADIVRVTQASAFFVHGDGLDLWAERMLENTRRPDASIFTVTSGIVHQGNESPGDHDHDNGHDGGDPHYWLDPTLVVHYVENIRDAFIQIDPAGAEIYQTRAEAYIEELLDLDQWIQDQVAAVPPARRKLVTNHDSLSHFARRYGFDVIGSVLPGFSSEAEPSARQIAQLVQSVKSAKAPAIFTESTANANVAETLAQETGNDVRIVSLYTGSLSPENGPAPSYLAMMRFNVDAIVRALQ